MKENNIKLTNLQEIAANKILNWFSSYDRYDENKKQIFSLAGYAGTGKTFLINYVIRKLELENDDVAFIAPTGKAANVLIQRGATNATTIHRLIYIKKEVEVKTKVGDDVIKTTSIKFIKRDSIPRYKLIILDEASMVEEKIMKDLVSFGIPIICCGDPFQLPPVMGDTNPLLKNPDVILTEIVRQESENAIVKLATSIRNGGELRVGNYGDVIIARKDHISKENRKYLFLNADQIICGKNSTRKEINKEVKEYLGLDLSTINIGEKIICLLNNWNVALDDSLEYYLVNGLMGYVTEFKPIIKEDRIGLIKMKADFLNDESEQMVIDMGNFKSDKPYFDFFKSVYLMSDGTYEITYERKKETSEDDLIKQVIQKSNALVSEKINFFDSAYCISCHKSQGSEWDKVVVIDESKCFSKEWRQWLYTAITRAKKKLVILI